MSADGPRFSRQTALATEDLISYLQSLEVNYPQVGHVIDMLIATPQVQELIDRLLLRWPELPKIVKGLEVFLRGRDGKAIAQAFEQVIPSIVQALFALYDKILVYVEEAGEALAEQGVRLFFHLRSPEVKESICKLMELPEIKILGVYLEEFNINLVQVFDKLQVVLTE